MGRSGDVPRAPGHTGGDDTGCHILHVDMDAFFASVEVQRRPDLRGRPVLVGGSTRGVVAAASYEARRYGIRSAMSMTRALQLCPHAVVLPPDRKAYTAASEQVMTILRSVTPLVEPLSLDEAFLDISGAQGLLGRPGEIAAGIREQIAATVGLTCSVGIAPTKFVAKVASARCKPDGMLLVPASDVLTFLHPLPVTVLWGVGARTAEPLHRLGVRTIGDLASTPIEVLRRAVGSASADHLAQLASGHDPRPVSSADVEKSISADRTTDTDLTETEQVSRELLGLADEVASRLRGRSMVARTVGIKIRFADFKTVTRVRTLPDWADSGSVLYRTALELYQGLDLDRPRIRLVGVKAEGLRPADRVSHQLSFDEALSRRPLPAALDRAADDVKSRFGAHTVRIATLLPAISRPTPGPQSLPEQLRRQHPRSLPGPASGSERGPDGNPTTSVRRSSFPDMNPPRILDETSFNSATDTDGAQ
jgi:DNA polymerase IV